MNCGGIDLGGTKIEARLFDGPDHATVAVRRVPTPTDSYAAMMAALIGQIEWLDAEADTRDMPIGIAVPGLVDPRTGLVFAANVRASGHAVAPDLAARLGRNFAVVNDCRAFALSEAVGGAGDGARVVMGLILGTGVGGGFCIDGALAPRLGGLAVEVGHVALPAAGIARHGLPVLPCGCGRLGCMETYVSGTGLSNLAEQMTGTRRAPEDLVQGTSATGGPENGDAARVLSVWADLAGECLFNIHLMLAPDVIVLGGGLSKMPGVVDRLNAALRRQAFGGMTLPRIALARHGDSSGARGAALLASASC